MSELDYQKQAQDYYGQAPVIVLGSGASAAHGISGMGALAKRLESGVAVLDLPSDDQEAWTAFISLLGSGVDLEAALHKVTISEALMSRIIKETWNLINSEDIVIFKNSLQSTNYLPLGKLLNHMFRTSITRINIITTNYDRLAEYACEQMQLHHYTGFTHGFLRQRAEPDELKIARKVNIWKVHGSLDWFKSPLGETLGLPNVESIPDNFEPKIVTPGLQKYQRTHQEPFRAIINNADQAIKAASSYLCIGYGFNDEHIQPQLIAKCARSSSPITIITYKLSESAKKLLFVDKIPNYLAIECGDRDDQSRIVVLQVY